MKPASVLSVLNNFLFYGFEKGIFEAVEAHIIEFDDGVASLCPPQQLGMIENGGLSVQEYIGILEKGTYSAVFDNGDILILQCRFGDEVLLAHRYFYIPCPFAADVIFSRPSHISIADWFRDSAALEPAESFRSRGALRFDCDRTPPTGGDPHPISHLTFASGGCRIPVQGPLQISAFLNFIFDNFFRDYRPIWWSFSSQMRLNEEEVTITRDESQYHHVGWEMQ